MKIVDFHIDGTVVIHRGAIARRYCPRTYSLHRVIKLIDRWKHVSAMGINGGLLVRAMIEYPRL